MGTTDPKVSGGFINTFEYKDWQLGVNFIFNLGMKVRVRPSYSPALSIEDSTPIVIFSIDSLPIIQQEDTQYLWKRMCVCPNIYNIQNTTYIVCSTHG